MNKTTLLTVLVATMLLTMGAAALAQTGDGYDLTWNTVDGGGVTWATGAGYSLGGTAGQADAGVLTGGGYTLAGGFWRAGTMAGTVYAVYLPLVLRNH